MGNIIIVINNKDDGVLRLDNIYNCKIPSQIKNISVTVNNVLKYFQESKGEIEDDILFDLKVILNELILNAIRHGNKENEMKYVNIKAQFTSDDKALVMVSDDGVGYDYSKLNENTCKNNALCDLPRIMETGRGIVIVRSLCETVEFNKSGNSIYIVKRLTSNK